MREKLTTSNAFIVVPSLDAAMHPSSAEPPSHIPANAAIDRAALKYITRSPSKATLGTHLTSSRSLPNSGSGLNSKVFDVSLLSGNLA